ncbi:acetyl-CoA carboxylase biotin carboxyl carrier protein [Cytophaga hutchinsonii]|uniref:Biotin carboxyl carrier protein of acetyl-CoA carboxylase n=1 Tax=Cytophaga hutchinsonii (strain ATCC 33406 / DSM 1761 / CIP 103989 / NBRC 15051 / NCIMB 9469 / D465) TaxID=269798 RepID=A0A6N4SRD1_CYTH3|nr:acetyl-CoA carboxylase biotin carboxyl carrier protein [Cytophaga hutchinsonii]ABG58892.1 biotin carboxyl carrier protein of acetyl-CoA carboxylase [Cytophaga hutchinsonii ATCC 33406]SFX81483.1 acetyl-CoA carboxylase biotin carboxyl carrier protein [Cytophaga hutchinsonii ATCC 33406]
MKPKEIQELIDFIASSGLAEVNIETEQFKINVKKYPNSAVKASDIIMPALPQVAPIQQLPATQAPVATPAAAETKVSAPAAESSNLITIKSPMIGTFYRSSSPETPSFVNVGDVIEAGKPVCIIEAMKLFNEIESEISGKIVKILVENATPVEYDQPLFLVEPK